MKFLDLDIDDWNEAEMARHHVTGSEVLQVLENDPVFLPNKKGHEATVIMVGPTFGGRLLTVPLRSINEEEGVWRPASAWEADADERVRYYRAQRR